MHKAFMSRSTAVVGIVLLVTVTFLPVSRAQYQNLSVSQNPGAKAEHLSRGEASLKESKFQEASREFRNAIQIDDTLADAHWGLARAYEGLQRTQEMIEELRKTAELDPKNSEARLKLGNIYLSVSKGRRETIAEADKLAQEVLNQDENNIEGHILLGSVLFAQNKPADALKELNHAISLDPKRAQSHLALANYYMVTRDNEKAEQTFRKAIEVNYNSSLAHREYGKFLVQQNRGGEAEVELLLAVEVAPTDRQALYLLASYYLVNKQFDKAAEAYKALAAVDKDRPEGQVTLADFYLAVNRLDEGILVYQDLLAKFPDYVQGRYRLAEILLMRGDTHGANAQIEEVLKKDTHDQQALLFRVRLRSVGNQPESLKGAIEDLKEVLRQEPNSRSGLYYMAQTHFSLGLLDQARFYASNLENTYPNYLRGKLIHAQINIAAGDAKTGLTQLSDLIDRLERATPDIDNSPKQLAELKQEAYRVRDTAQHQIMKTTNYPVARKGDQVDDYHGVKVADPYRWLEDLDSSETASWVEAENKLTFDYLAQIPARASIKERITKLWNYEKYGVPFKEGERYFYSRNSGLQNQSVLYTVPSLEAQPQQLLDPNTLSNDGTVAVSGMSVSDDGNLLAYSLSASGSDWQEWKVRNVESGQDLADHLKWAKFSSASWTSDSKGFYYARYDEPKGDSLKDANYFQKVYYHKLGTPQSDDTLVYERPDQKDWLFGAGVTEDGNYVIITVFQGTDVKTRVYYKDLKSPNAQVVKLLDDFDASYTFVGNEGNRFWIQTDQGAPRGKVIEIDINKPARGNWKVVIPESRDTLQSVSVLNHNLVANYLHDAYTQVKIFDTTGKFLREVEFPGIGSADGFSGRPSDKETFYSFTGFTTPTTIYRYDLVTGKSTVFRQPKVDFNPADYETKQVFYPSKDGTKIPMFLTYKKGIKLDGNNPTYLYGYGGFNVSLTPAFSVGNLVWMELGGVYAQPNLRGGGEYGEEWHQAGSKLKKQNVFDDFIYAAQWLIANKYTSTPKLAIGGGSNGGLLVGAAMIQRPDLFGAALPAVGVMDMLRFQKFTIGWAWVSDYGSSENAAEFKTLYAYSPLHNIKPGTRYPPTMVTTADHDDRVWPGHSFKFAAALQAAQAGPAPVLIRIETKAGHGAGKPTSKIIEEVADRWAFLVKTLEMKF